MYRQLDGEITLDGNFEAYGYSGSGVGKNNPDLENVPNVGPIPRGRYLIQQPPYDDPHKGQIVFRLTPVGHDAHGRSGFLIHGDNITHTASHGCIIAGRLVRQAIRDDNETELEVV
jgi:lipoprotein-anchoring transpeptidase ErfK/SrfK